MTTQEAIEKLKNYDELEGKYNEALARIDEYEWERAEVLAQIVRAKEDIEKEGIISGALNSAINLLEPPASEDEIEVGDIVKDDRDGEIGMYIGKGPDGVNHVLIFRYNEEFCDTFLTYSTEHWKKTGEHCSQMAEILSKVRGENVESSENPE